MSVYGVILLLICVIDLLTTVIWLEVGFTEEHPILLWYFNSAGTNGLITAKIWLNGLSLFVLEIIYRYEIIPIKRIKAWYTAAIAVYLIVYGTGVLKVNNFFN